MSTHGPSRRHLLRAATAGLAVAAGSAVAFKASAEDNSALNKIQEAQAFYGANQSGITTPQQPYGILVAFDCLAEDKAGLERLFRLLTEHGARLMAGGPVPEAAGGFPPPDSGLMGKTIPPDGLTITVSVGASLFNGRYGLAAKKPARLITMVQFANDALDEAYCHGDILIQFCANRQETALHAVRDIVKNTPSLLAPRWKMDGQLLPKDKRAPGEETPRNFLGFKDGTANLPNSDDTMMNQMVWTKGGQNGEPEWTQGGSYQVVRIISNFVEHWDRTALNEQERIIGRHKYSGAPIGKVHEMDDPDFVSDPDTSKTAKDAHIRLANPRDGHAMARRILRRGYNYSLGLNKNGQMNMGLLFVCFQADLEQGFLAIQARLNGEALEEYIKPFGGGYFFALPGVQSDQNFLGEGLLKA